MPARDLVVELVHSMAAGPEGRVFLSNALDSIAEDLVGDDFVRDYLDDLADCCIAASSEHWWSHLEDLSLARSPAPPRRLRGYLRSAAHDSSKHRDGNTLATVCAATVFSQFHIDIDKLTDEMVSVPTFPPRDRDEAQRLLESVIRTDGWCLPAVEDGGAWLGVPPAIGRNCWLSCLDLGDEIADDDRLNPTDAGELCEALGVLPIQGQWYLRYSFPASAARRLAGGELRRPTFADLGSDWFRVMSTHVLARRNADLGWGTTVNIAALRVPNGPDSGLPERVSSALPIETLFGLGIEILVPRSAIVETIDSARPFESRLRSACSEAELVTRVLNLWVQ